MSDKSSDDDEDLLVMGPDLGEDQRPFIRKNSEGLHAGILKLAREGEPISEDALHVQHRGPGPLYDVKPVFDKNSRSRPASAGYRKGWDRIFGGKPTVGQA